MVALDSRIAALITALGTDYKKFMFNTNGGAETVGSALATSGAVTANLNNGSVFPISPTGTITSFTLSNPPASGKACSVRICATNGSTAYLIPLPTGGIWYGATPVPAANKKTIYDYFTTDGGSSWHCSAVNQV